RDTFLGWCESPFASGEVADRLSMHRNSLQYRLKKIRALTGKDPWNFKDAFELWAAFVLKNISTEDPAKQEEK
ncbi:MAG: helix-turn-helix domain-containing protein, partial [Cloacibacillus sp.]